MGIKKPFYRTYRPQTSAPNSGYSDWAYIHDVSFASHPQQYVRAFLIIQQDYQKLFEYIEPGDESKQVFSIRIHELFMRACIEIEANFKEILRANGYFPAIRGDNLNMAHYQKVNVSHHLSAYEVLVPLWNGKGELFKPFASWDSAKPLAWYQDYNTSKHDRVEGFKLANLGNLTNAISALVILLTAQFSDEEFTSGSAKLSIGDGYDYYEYSSAIGSFFRIKFPDNWLPHELYDFDWEQLKKETERFQKYDYNL